MAELVQPNRQIVDDLDAFIAALPERVAEKLRVDPNVSSLIEVVLDLGRAPEARFPDGYVRLADGEVTQSEIARVVETVGHFGDDNRAGIERTLHRMSVIRNRAGDPVGLTCRVGRAVFGSVRLIHDLVESGERACSYLAAQVLARRRCSEKWLAYLQTMLASAS